MDKYQKYLMESTCFSGDCNYSFSDCNDVLTITQDDDIFKNKYTVTINVKDENDRFDVFVLRKDKWEKVARNGTQYIVPVDFEDRTEGIKFVFKNNLADDCIVSIMYVEADEEKYYAEQAKAKREALLTAADVKVATGTDLVNVYFQPCYDEYGHTEITFYIPKDFVTVGSPYGPVKKPSTWNVFKKIKIDADEYYASLQGLAYGEYSLILKQYDGKGVCVLETDRIEFSIKKPPQQQIGRINVI